MATVAFRDNQWTFLIELLAEREEKGLLLDLRENPDDKACIAAYTDYLIEKGRVQSAEMIQQGFIPGATKIVKENNLSFNTSGSIPPYIASGPYQEPQLSNISVLSGQIGVGYYFGRS